ncbi:MAG TPA: NUDIX domain-containing protein [Vicinamibacterales bacterium]|nr:NUDIX domain-containing protein [Vicinamibacterales bacterium]
MPRKQAAGLLLFRGVVGALEVLLVHPGGPLWARKDDGAWSIPKGEVEPDEDALAAARREVEEETGARPSGTFIALSPVRQTGGKIVHVWAIESDFDPASLKSNLFEMEWPPKSGNRRSFPEVDRAAWFDLETAGRKILPSQAVVLQHLQERLTETGVKGPQRVRES